MANFAINCSDEIINRGNALIAKMAEGTDEKKGETLNRIFALVEKSMDDIVMQNNGVDTKGLDAALSDIRKMFESVASSRERLLAEEDQQIAQLQAEKSTLKTRSRKPSLQKMLHCRSQKNLQKTWKTSKNRLIHQLL